MDIAQPDLLKRTKSFAIRIIRLYSALPKSTVAQTIGKQLLKSGTSVGANYREAYRGRSRAEFVAILGISLRELEETGYWLELLEEADILPAKRLVDLRSETKELIAIFVTIIKKSRK